MKNSVFDRFWRRVAIGDGCWEWNGPPGSHGYGQAQRADKTITTAPRLAFEITFGKPKNWVLHRCNNRMCVRPSHLYDGTHKENMDDVSRGRYHPKRKLTSAEVVVIRGSSDTQRALAAEYNVSQRTILNVLQMKNYRHG